MAIFFTSDTHFGHRNIITYCDRPWNSVEEMNEELIARWNNVVGPRDDVYHLGDFCMGRKSVPGNWVPRLNGRIHLIRGNHDPVVKGQGFETVQDYLEVKYYKKKIVLFHYPIRNWNGSHKGSWHLFGHVHGTLTVKYGRKCLEDSLAMDVGSDCHDWRPISADEVVEIMIKQEKYLKEKFATEDPKGELSNKDKLLRKRIGSL
tara:strand:+ start:117076 stop:117687 length:612 start_codon:yes stop_codon:yes gene_type:complete